MRLYYVTYLVPSHVSPLRAADLESGIQALLHALRPPPGSPGVAAKAPLCGALVQLAGGPAWLVAQLTALSPDVCCLIVPSHKSEPCVTYPPELLPMLEINRADWEMTCVKFSKTAATLPKRKRGLGEVVKGLFKA
jgi:hypothetical protein